MFKGLSLNLESKKIWNHHPNLPAPFRMLIVGPSGSGKTNLYLQMCLEPDFIDYNNLVQFTSNPTSKDEYQFLYHGFSNKLSKQDLGEMWLAQNDLSQYRQPIPILCQIFASHKEREGNLNGNISSTLSDKIKEIPLPEHLDKEYGKKDHLIVFDDCARENKKMMEIYYTESRHANCNCIYIAQDFFTLPQNVRINSNIIILFEQNPEKLSRIFNSCIGDRIMSRDRFIAFANHAWSKPYGYVAINKVSKQVMDDIFTL
jgi:hypothetical protein